MITDTTESQIVDLPERGFWSAPQDGWCCISLQRPDGSWLPDPMWFAVLKGQVLEQNPDLSILLELPAKRLTFHPGSLNGRQPEDGDFQVVEL